MSKKKCKMKPIKLKKEVYFDCSEADLAYLKKLQLFLPYSTYWEEEGQKYFIFNQDVSFTLYSFNYGAKIYYSPSKTLITFHNLVIADEILRFERKSRETDLTRERELFVSMMNRFKSIILKEVRRELEVLIDTYFSSQNSNIKEKSYSTIGEIVNESFNKACHEIRSNGNFNSKKNYEIIESEKKILDTVELLRKQTLEALN